LALAVENRRHRLHVRPFAPAGPGRTLVLPWRRGSVLRDAFNEVVAIIRAALGPKKRR
jgi:LysR family hydrogen peroxide-inducible transcriptional activator